MFDKRPVVVIVDDEVMITESLSTYLELTTDYVIHTYNDPELAVQELQEMEFDLIASDFLMPGMNGLDFLLKVRGFASDAVMILLTGYADKENAIRAINELNLFQYVEKPWDNHRLSVIIRNGIEYRRLAKELRYKSIELENSMREVNETRSEIERKLGYIHYIENQKTEIEKQRKEIKSLMDNAGEGFLFFGSDLGIKGSYSHECTLIFDRIAEGVHFSSLIHGSEKERRLLDEIFRRIINSQDMELYESLLPPHALLSEKWIEFKYKLIEAPDGCLSIMVIASDVTAEKQLEEQVERERIRLRSIVSILTNRDEFLSLISEYEEFIKTSLVEQLLSDDSDMVEQDRTELFRRVHTFRGSLSQYDLLESAALLNRVEEYLLSSDHTRRMDLIEIAKEFRSSINREVGMLASYVGKEFFRREKIYMVSEKKLLELEDQIKVMLPPDDGQLVVRKLALLRQKSLKQLLRPYSSFCIHLASRQDKNILPFDIQGDDVEVSYEKLSRLVPSLVHVFRNAVSHGIETMERRLEIGKPENGRVSCYLRAERDKGHYQIVIQDDGQGIDRERLFALGKESGLIRHEKLVDCPEEELFGLIFLDRITTVKERSQHAGSGVGLAAVKAEVDALGGSILVESELGNGTTFIITVPDDQAASIAEEGMEDGIDEIMEYSFLPFAEEYMERLLIGGRQAKRACREDAGEKEIKALEVWLGLRMEPVGHGARTDRFNLSVGFEIPYRVALALYDGFNREIPHDEDEGCTKDTLEDTMAEILNNMCGNWSPLMEGYSLVLLPYEMNESEEWRIVKEIGQDGEELTLRISNAKKVKGR